ncbi:MAG: aldo/keto reductase [Ferrovibrio sp.]|uniref:aldo/keto reductase n=1 Tax=Ferrovibrio sp. TaxID=1917215 RepID=UPI00262C7A41|nr:aldo/keto reductase [Ferrovibrio sp.]MCW0235075.1 aldo/keto reductase [Ferrovibrio sp.]
MTTNRTVRLPGGETIPRLGQGTWQMAEKPGLRKAEIAALRLGLDLGMTLIDTAEMYADGGSEELVAEAIAGRRDEVFLVSKVLPSNSSRKGTLAACERSLKRLRTGRIDLYLLHWRGSPPLAETLDAFETLQQAGKIRHWGVSNFDTGDMAELSRDPRGTACATNQVLYNLTRRGIEFDLLPWQRQQQQPVMAYSPIEQGRLARHKALQAISQKHAATPAQIALAWLLRQDNVISIPKATAEQHVRDNHAALDLMLTAEDLVALDAAFPPPKKARPLEMI